MAVSLKRALMELLTDWPDDLPPEWRDACAEVELGFDNADLQLAFGEPVVPVRRDRNFPRLRDRPPAHNGADVGLREPRRSRGALRRDVRRPQLARVHRRDLRARGHSRSGRGDHEPGAVCTGRRYGAGLPLRVVFWRAPIGARH